MENNVNKIRVLCLIFISFLTNSSFAFVSERIVSPQMELKTNVNYIVINSNVMIDQTIILNYYAYTNQTKTCIFRDANNSDLNFKAYCSNTLSEMELNKIFNNDVNNTNNNIAGTLSALVSFIMVIAFNVYLFNQVKSKLNRCIINLIILIIILAITIFSWSSITLYIQFVLLSVLFIIGVIGMLIQLVLPKSLD